MAALAEVFLKMGKEVVGSDTKEKFFTDETLKKLGIKFYEGFSKENIKKEKPDLAVYSTAYNAKNNEECEFAIRNNIESVSYPEALGELIKSKFGIAVCGTHGKTTTTAMLALAMKKAGADPTAIIGSRVNEIGSNALVGNSQYFIIEADEYQNKFLHYNPIGIVLTSLDFDHPDFFKDFSQYKEAFKNFIRKIPRHGFLVAFKGDADVVEIAKEAKCQLVFYDQGVKYESFKTENLKNTKYVEAPAGLNLKVPGRHNIQNATAAFAVCEYLKLDKQKVIEALNDYQGVVRRFEFIGKCNGAEIIDDYAHHPEEIKATLKTAKQLYSYKNIICVFQPHTFSRTRALFSQFSQSFNNCDEVVILDIFGSAREKQGGVSSKELVEEIKKYHRQAEHIPNIEKAYEIFKNRLSHRDVLITMGAGEGDKLAKKLAQKE